ncbi:TonB-dependent receptor [Dysgonomonas sp. ZJ279]|uniref:TonB-dependent receptor n=1 Tax=Dysgonomonas sp. ZJ279 TaxID=2709796 RepID=UPI0013EE2492|nr:TonB-dependent receptor [Dysgonomonas sp. ZJ279]
MFKNIIRLLSICLLYCCTTSLYAQGLLDSIQQMKEVIIIAKPFQEVIPTQRLSGTKLQQLSNHTVSDALRYFAGIQIKDYGGIGGIKTVNVRNMGTHHVGVFYDGIQLGNAQNGVVDLGRFSLDDMEELSLYNGQKSETFQSARDFGSAASIYLRTKKPKFEKDKKTNLLVRYKAGSIQLINPSVRWEQKLSNKLSMNLSSEYIKSDGKYKFRYKRANTDGSIAYDTTATRKNSDIEALRIEGGLYGVVADGYWESKIYYYDSERGLPGAIVNNVFYNGDRLWDKNFFAQSSYNKDFTPKYKFQLKGKFAYDYTHYLSNDTTLFMGEVVNDRISFNNTYYQQEVYLSAINMYSPTSWWDISLSTDFQWNKLNATMSNYDNFAYPKRTTTLVALASSVKVNKVKAQASLLGSFVQESVRNGKASPNKSEITPAIVVGYKPFEKHDFNLRAFYKRVFRMPTFNDLYYAEIGYSDLKPEYTNQYNIGFSYNKQFKESNLDAFTLQVDAYYLDIENKIIASPTSSNFRWMMTNIGKVENKGLDVVANLQGHIGKVNLSTNLTYSYSKAQDFTKTEPRLSSYGDQIPYTPWHSGSAILNAGYESWNMNYSFIYVGERYDGGINNIKRNHIQPWYTHDMSVQKTFNFKNYRVKSSVEVNNALNQYYDVVLNFPMPGRNFRFILSIEI